MFRISPTAQRLSLARLTGVPATLALVVAMLGVHTQATAQEAKLPPAKQVLEKSLEKMGGAKLFDSVKTMRQDGTFEMSAMGIKGSLTVHYHSDGRYAVTVDMAAMGQSREGYNGKVMWEMAPMQAPRILKGDEKKIKIRMQRVNPLKDFEKYYSKWENVGIKKVGAASCYELKLTPKVGSVETHFIDTTTFLAVRTKMKMPSAQGEMEVVVDLKDYKRVEGMLLPGSQKMNLGGMMNMTMKFTAMTVNKELPKDVFALPDEIKKLAAKQAATSKPTSRKSN